MVCTDCTHSVLCDWCDIHLMFTTISVYEKESSRTQHRDYKETSDLLGNIHTRPYANNGHTRFKLLSDQCVIQNKSAKSRIAITYLLIDFDSI